MPKETGLRSPEFMAAHERYRQEFDENLGRLGFTPTTIREIAKKKCYATLEVENLSGLSGPLPSTQSLLETFKEIYPVDVVIPGKVRFSEDDVQMVISPISNPDGRMIIPGKDGKPPVEILGPIIFDLKKKEITYHRGNLNLEGNGTRTDVKVVRKELTPGILDDISQILSAIKDNKYLDKSAASHPYFYTSMEEQGIAEVSTVNSMPPKNGFLETVRQKVYELMQGFSEGDLERARGILDGSIPIMDEDRVRQKVRMADKLISLISPSLLGRYAQGSIDSNTIIGHAEAMRTFREQIEIIDQLTNEEVDREICNDARSLVERAETRKKIGKTRNLS